MASLRWRNRVQATFHLIVIHSEIEAANAMLLRDGITDSWVECHLVGKEFSSVACGSPPLVVGDFNFVGLSFDDCSGYALAVSSAQDSHIDDASEG
jgi:hypothetical protein